MKWILVLFALLVSGCVNTQPHIQSKASIIVNYQDNVAATFDITVIQ